ncbi:hypothetical protein [Carboxylicivirga taeanensis]|uniref:hypothetical protein n=1 Tax=Carboxylicivirga taeanensis TaxID=1416875 RepID=UPI003F6DEA51
MKPLLAVFFLAVIFVYSTNAQEESVASVNEMVIIQQVAQNTGVNNSVFIAQVGTGGLVDATQAGENNYIHVIQLGAGNTTDIVQEGDRNVVFNKFVGSDNSLKSLQVGNDNTQNIIHLGTDTHHEVTQIGDGHKFTYKTYGNAQGVVVTQEGPPISITVEQGQQGTL